MQHGLPWRQPGARLACGKRRLVSAAARLSRPLSRIRHERRHTVSNGGHSRASPNEATAPPVGRKRPPGGRLLAAPRARAATAGAPPFPPALHADSALWPPASPWRARSRLKQPTGRRASTGAESVRLRIAGAPCQARGRRCPTTPRPRSAIASRRPSPRLGLFLDAKKLFPDTDARDTLPALGGAPVRATVRLDPLGLQAGLIVDS